MNALFTLFHLALMAYLLFWAGSKEIQPLRGFFWPAVLFKLFCGLALAWLYFGYYQVGDTLNYFNDGMSIARMGRDGFGEYLSFLWSGEGLACLTVTEPRSLFMAKITSVFCWATHGQYFLVSLWFSLISFAGAWYLVKNVAATMPDSIGPAAVAFLFFPSVVFWGSGVMKESLAMGGLFFLSAVFLRGWFGIKIRPAEWALLPLALWLLWNLKYFYLGVFIPVAITTLACKWILSHRRFPYGYVGEMVIWSTLLALPLLAVSFLHPNFYWWRLPEVVASNYQSYLTRSPESMVHYNNLEGNWASILENSPWALFSALFRPTLLEATRWIYLPSIFENTVLLVLALKAAPGLLKVHRSPYRLLVFALLVYIVLLGVFLALSTPNLGTLVRYRIGFLPFFVYLVLYNNPWMPIFWKWASSLFRLFARKG